MREKYWESERERDCKRVRERERKSSNRVLNRCCYWKMNWKTRENLEKMIRFEYIVASSTIKCNASISWTERKTILKRTTKKTLLLCCIHAKNDIGMVIAYTERRIRRTKKKRKQPNSHSKWFSVIGCMYLSVGMPTTLMNSQKVALWLKIHHVLMVAVFTSLFQ